MHGFYSKARPTCDLSFLLFNSPFLVQYFSGIFMFTASNFNYCSLKNRFILSFKEKNFD